MARILVLAIALTTSLAVPSAATAHVGPPFPIVLDHAIPGYVIEVWTDPDVGEAVFYVVFEPTQTAAAKIEQVDLWVQPVSGRLPRAVHRATPEATRGAPRFVARPHFDQAEMWTVGVNVRLASGNTYQLQTAVEATPPGLGPWDVLIYLFPFLLFGGLWGYAFLKRSREAIVRRSAPSDQASRGNGSKVDL